MQRWMIFLAIGLGGFAVLMSAGKGLLPLLLSVAGLVGFLFLLRAGRK